MPLTLTIKQVPERIAAKLRLRAAAAHRSLQGELMAILEKAVLEPPLNAREPDALYRSDKAPRPARRKAKPHGKRLSLAQLWDRAQRLGSSPSESTVIVRSLRDERHRR